MDDRLKIGIVGSGNMGRAIAEALYVDKYSLYIYDKEKEKTKGIKGIIAGTLDELLNAANIVILAIKPQDIKDFIKNAPELARKGLLLISIAAGVPTYFFEREIGEIRVIRVMPNLAAKVKEAVSFICKGRFASNEDLNTALGIFKNIGIVFAVEEDFLDKATSISGSGPGYVYYFMEALYRGALSLGFESSIAKEMVIQTLWGAVKLIKQSGDDFSTAMSKVASRGGTTQAGFNVFEENKFNDIVKNAVDAAFLRAKELSAKL